MAKGQPATGVGKRGTVVIPATLRRRFGITEGALVIAEETAEGILIRPAVALPIELYSPQRRAEFLLSNAVDGADYARAVEVVREMGLDPAAIPHHTAGVAGRAQRRRVADIVFLDANVLFSAAYRPNRGCASGTCGRCAS